MVDEKKKNTDALEGMKAISKFVGRGESTIIQWINTENFPAVKKNLEWIASRKSVTTWIKKRGEKQRKAGNMA